VSNKVPVFLLKEAGGVFGGLRIHVWHITRQIR